MRTARSTLRAAVSCVALLVLLAAPAARLARAQVFICPKMAAPEDSGLLSTLYPTTQRLTRDELCEPGGGGGGGIIDTIRPSATLRTSVPTITSAGGTSSSFTVVRTARRFQLARRVPPTGAREPLLTPPPPLGTTSGTPTPRA